MTTTKSATTDIFTQWAKLLPSGSYLTFKSLQSVLSNNGMCDNTEKILMGTAIFIFSVICAISTFTDSYVAENSKLFYEIASPKGSWNPAFLNSGLADVSGSTYVGGGTHYVLKKSDFVHAFLAVLSFATLSLLSQQTTDCLYGTALSDLKKAMPLLVAVIVLFVFAFSPSARNGIGYAVLPVRRT